MGDVSFWCMSANIPGKARPFPTHLRPESIGGVSDRTRFSVSEERC